ncbi:MAG: alkaline phosphatase, partial [Sarcina sp.]
TLTHIINNKAGIGWTSYSHTGVPVPVYAIGQSAVEFNGSYDNTDIFKKLVKTTGVK